MKALRRIVINVLVVSAFFGLCCFLDEMTPDVERTSYHSSKFYGMKQFLEDESTVDQIDNSKFWGVPSF